jgi:hypothetical protein
MVGETTLLSLKKTGRTERKSPADESAAFGHQHKKGVWTESRGREVAETGKGGVT